MGWDESLPLENGKMAKCPKCGHLTPCWEKEAPAPRKRKRICLYCGEDVETDDVCGYCGGPTHEECAEKHEFECEDNPDNCDEA
jgi:adenine-specific DNA methylase